MSLTRTIAKVASTIAVLVIVFSPFVQVFETPVVRALDCPAGSAPASGGGCITTTADANGHYKLFDPATGNNLLSGSSDTTCSTSALDICISNVVYVFTVGLGTGIAYLASTIFSFAVKLSLQGEAYALTFISQAWGVVRDLANMSFIFILLYLAFTIMLRAETTKTMQILSGVVVVAMLVNFSFFLTRLVIDGGNIVAVQFYNMIPDHTIAQTAAANGTQLPSAAGATATKTKDLTASIMGGINIQSALNTDSFAKYTDSFKNSGAGSMFLSRLIALSFMYICIGIVMFMLAAAFFTAAVQFIVRVVALWLAIIASPLALVARTLQYTRHWYDSWQDMLVKNTIYPAVFLFVFWILTLFTQSLAECGNGTSVAAGNCSIAGTIFNDLATQGSGNWFQSLVYIITTIGVRLGFVIAILYFGFKASEMSGMWGSRAAKGISQGIAGFGFRSAARSSAFAGRNTIGRGMYALTRTPGFKDAIGTGIIGNTLLRSTNALGKASFDFRNAPGGSILKKATGLTTLGSIDTGKAVTTSYEGNVKKRAKEVADRAKEFKGDELEARNRQIRAEKNYKSSDGKFEGKSGFDNRIKELAEQAKAAASINDKKQKEALEKEMKSMREMGKNELDSKNKERLTSFADRLSTRNWSNFGLPSTGSIKGSIAVRGILGGKSTHEQTVELLKKINEEHGAEHDEEHGGDGHDEPPKGGGPKGGGGGSGGGNTPTPPAAKASAPSTPAPEPVKSGGGSHDNHGGGGHAHSSAEGGEVSLSKDSMNKLAGRVASLLERSGALSAGGLHDSSPDVAGEVKKAMNSFVGNMERNRPVIGGGVSSIKPTPVTETMRPANDNTPQPNSAMKPANDNIRLATSNVLTNNNNPSVEKPDTAATKEGGGEKIA